MTLIHGFICTEQFYDDTNFPRGFKKTGDFSIAEAELLTSIGKRLFMLEENLCSPENQIEEQFVHVCKIKAECESKVQLLWQKYKHLIRHKQYHCLSGNTY